MIQLKIKDYAPCYFGIDISRDNIDICLIDDDGKVLKNLRLSSNKTGFENLVELIPPQRSPIFCVENTGPHSGNLFHYLKQRDFDCLMANAYDVSRLREAFSKGVKTDLIDAFVLAQAARMQVIKHSSKDMEYVYLQDILERFHDVKESKTALINQIRANLVETFPEITKVYKKIDSISMLTILSHYSSSQSFKDVDLGRVKDQIELNGGRSTMGKLQTLQELCRDSVAWKVTVFHERIIQSQIREFQSLLSEYNEVEKLVDEYVEVKFSDKMELLQSIPGVGKIVAMQALAVIGDHRRFDLKRDGKGSKRVSSFVGFGLREYSSGSTTRKGGISKRGNPTLRGQLFMAAFSAVRYDVSIAAYYESKKERGGGKLATVSVAHLLLRRIYGVLKSGKKYNPAIPAAG
jgi:transposase